MILRSITSTAFRQAGFVLAALAIPITLLAFGPEQAEKDAQKAAQQWLALLDAGKYGQSWEDAAEFFKSSVNKSSWEQQVSSARSNTGKFQARKLRSIQYTESLPNAPAGKYVVIQYDSTFATGSWIETAVLMQEKDGSWKISGYFIKPTK